MAILLAFLLLVTLGAGAAAADRCRSCSSGSFAFAARQPLSVPGDHALLAARGAGRRVRDAGALVALDEQPLRGGDVRRHDVLHRRHLRRRCARSPGRHRVSWVSFTASLNQVGDVIFRLPPRYDTPVVVSIIVLLGAGRGLGLGARAPRARRGGGGVSAPIVAAEQLSKWYGQVIGLNDVTVSVPPGITGLLGPNGAGKSTFLKLITGQLKPSKGTVTRARRADLGQPAALFPIGFCPEQDSFYERMTGLEWVTALVRLERLQRDGGGRRGAPRARHRRSARRRGQEDRRLQQGHAPAREAGAGAGPRSGAADPRRAADRHGSADAAPHHQADQGVGAARGRASSSRATSSTRSSR